MKNMMFLLFAFSFFSACEKDTLLTGGDYFFLRNQGAVMPVWVRGNIASNVFIIHLHGGPGGSSIEEAEQKVYLDLESDYAMVYWDQRASGASQGKAQPETITMEQFVEDLEQLIAVINDKYNNPVLFLHGHSWGGALGTAFLVKPGNQAKVKGWIELDGAHNFKKGLVLSREWSINYANQAIATGQDTAFWREALRWYEQYPVLDTKSILDVHTNKYLSRANGYIFNLENPNLTRFQGGSLHSPAGDQNNGDYVQTQLQTELKKGYSDQMKNITIPALVLWGQHDGIMPVAMAQDAYDHLGTPVSDKKVVIFENSAHSPNREEPDLFIGAVKQFVEQYK